MHAFILAALLAPPTADPSRAAVDRTLDEWHLAAATANEEKYFEAIAENGVFLGTDATERWTKRQFRAFAHPYFAKGEAWTFKADSRNVDFSPDGKIAWFDERLTTKKLGPCRGSGVLVQMGGSWRIVQYNLSTPIPNAIFGRVKAMIEEELKKPAR